MTIDIGQIWQRTLELGAPDAKTAKHTWRVVTDNKFTRGQAIIAYGIGTGDFPERFTPHPDDGTLTVRTLTATNQADSPYHWIVEANYSSAPLSEKEKEKETQPNPLLRPVRIKWKSQKYREAISKCRHVRFIDATGTELFDSSSGAIVNAAGDFVDPTVETDRSYWQITLTKNVASVDDWVLDVDNPVNDGSISIGGKTFASGTVRIDSIDISELQSEGAYQYYVLTFELEYRKSGHKVLAQNQGFRQIKDGSLIEILDAKKQRISAPWPLDIDGLAIENPSPEDAVFIECEVCEEMDFSVLPLT
jgi:hypothetical protein